MQIILIIIFIMEEKSSIKTINSFNESKFKEKGSIFIGQTYEVINKNEAETYLAKVRKKYFDSTHVCFAYKLVDDTFQYSDDGEPNGTAGIRIMNAIEHYNLTNTLVLVIRYYGGTKLGVGPLGKAYYKSAYNTLATAKIKTQKFYSIIKIIFDYNFTSQVHHIIKQYSAINIRNKFEAKPIIECSIESHKIPTLIDDLIQHSAGTVETVVLKKNVLIDVSPS